MKNRIYIVIVILFAVVFGVSANTLKKAKELYLSEKYEEALPIFQNLYKTKKKDGSINHWLGVCLYETGKKDDAIKYLEFADTKNIIESSHYLAKIHFSNYDFESAIEMYARYKELLEDAEKEMSKDVVAELSKAKNAKSMLDHVEKIAVIDSILVDKQSFFKHYRISAESGTLLPNTKLPVSVEEQTVGFLTQSEDKLMWAMPDENGVMRLAESVKLIDGTWDQYQLLSEELNDNGNANYPYMLQDGSTLYFATDGDGSIGGYDIFMTRKNSETGEYYKAQNIGMPYNSLADDYLLVLDDATGIGWWATDRNYIQDKVTIYVFVRNDIRENYDIQTPNLINYAQISSYRDTWGGKDYSLLKNKIYTLNTNALSNDYDFLFYVSKGVIYTSLSDFKSQEASTKMEKLIDLHEKQYANKCELSDMRFQYSLKKDTSLKSKILLLEKTIEELRGDIFKLENEIRTLENNIN